jgi:competence protein ComEC
VGVRAALDAVSAVDWMALPVAPPALLQLALMTALAFLIVKLRNKVGRWAFAGLALALAVSYLPGFVERRFSNTLRITHLSVGHGDAAILELPGGHALLIDGGGTLHGEFDVGRQVVAPALRSLGLSRLDAVVLSHPHPDHAGGLAHVVRAFSVGEIWHNGRPYGRGAATLEAAVREVGAHKRVFRAGAAPVEMGGVTLEVLHPKLPSDEPHPYYAELDENDNSVVLLVRFGSFAALFPGDLEALGEQVLLESGAKISATLLKSPHHGSRTSSTPPFLHAVSPRVVVFSVGEASAFRFPSEEVQRRVRSMQADEFRTDLDGAIRVTTDGRTVAVETLRSHRKVELTLP